MKLLMLCREPRLYSCQRLKEAAESCGHQMDILDPNRCILKFDKINRTFLCIINKMQKVSLIYCLIMMRCYHALGRQAPKWAVRYYVISKGRVSIALIKNRHFLAARDKWRSLQMLLEQGIACSNFSLIGL